VLEPARGRADLAVIGVPGASVIARVMGMLLAALA
jgi:small neutral amino acid transporter SnatA (MarC family)